jgi:CHAT domain-containing protein/tetratricopeptide (TPR) repeat protein
MGHGHTAAAALAIALLSGAFPERLAVAAPPDSWELCREGLSQRPDDYESAYCFYTAALERRERQDGMRMFEALLHEHPGNLWLPLAYGHLHRTGRPGADLEIAEQLYRRAADGFRAASHAEGEALARISLRDILTPQGRLQDATAEVARVIAIGTTVDDAVLKARIWTMEASHVLETGGDLGHAYRLLKQSARAIDPDGPYPLRRACLGWLGLVAFRMGRLDEATRVFRTLDTLARGRGDLLAQATAQYNILNTESAKETVLPTTGGRERLMRLAREVLEIGTRASHPAVTLKAHRVIAELLAGTPASREDALQHGKRCLDLAVAINRAEDEALCSWLMATLLYSTSPAQAQAAQLRALGATARANNPASDVVAASRHMQFGWLSKSRPEAIRDSLTALEAIETLRSLQDTTQSSAEAFSIRTPEYYWLSGRLLLDGRNEDVDLAFSITERLRARALLDARALSRTPADLDGAAAAARTAVLRDIATVQRRLMDPTLAGPERRTILEQLDLLEEREQSAARLVALSTKAVSTTAPTFARLADVQAALGRDEALLSFQVGTSETSDGSFGGGSWLIVVTRDRRSVHRIPDRGHFAPLVPIFTGLLSRGDGLETSAALRLYADVFSGALQQLPPAIGRLILVPDGPLQHLAFDALRSSLRSQPLGVRHELVVVPSATLWLEWKHDRPAPADRRALVLADPELHVDNGGGSPVRLPSPRAERASASLAGAFREGGKPAATGHERNGVLQRGLTLARLPYARREGRAIERELGGVEAVAGLLASEHLVKTRDLRNYEIVHFAAHAVADDARPERSAVFLAPGSENEDGLLQSREIAALDLDGRIVVLSACQTASGAVLNGEGVLSLARAFFEAGARAVIGTRWPIRDEDAAWLFASFYHHLGRGASLSSALARTRVEAIASGHPPRVWAALVLLGDGTLRPFPDGRIHAVSAGRTMTVLLLASIVVAGCVISARRQRSSARR